MTAIVVNGQTSFGGMSNAAIANLINAVNDIHRVHDAIAQAQSGYTPPSGATAGAAVEGDTTNFGVVADAANPGVQGDSFVYALNTLDAALQTFFTTNEGSIAALDNGG